MKQSITPNKRKSRIEDGEEYLARRVQARGNNSGESEGSGNSNKPPQTRPPQLEGMIYVPTVNLYFAKQRSHLGSNWNESQEALHSEGLKMPTIKQTWELINYLRTDLNNPEFRRVYDDILKKTSKDWHGEWQNAKFVKEKDGMYLQEVRFENGNLVISRKRKLEDCLMENGFANINSTNTQGLLTTRSSKSTYVQGENIYFYYPRNGRVARFVAITDRAYLYCDGNPSNRNDLLGVRGVREANETKNFGGKK